jgi:predicted dehydrogenase
MRIGIIGAGFVGRTVHFPAWGLVPGAAIVAVCDPDPAARADAARLVPGAEGFDDHRALLACGVDAVSICTPNLSHGTIARDALRAGVHALVEKPVCVTPAEVRTLGAEADARGLVLMARHQLRFDNEAEALRARVADLGPIRQVRARALRRDRIPTTSGLTDAAQAGGGAALDLGVHVLDMALWLMGFPAIQGATVSATMSGAYGRGEVADYRNHWGDWKCGLFNVEDSATALVTLPQGATISLECAWAGDFSDAETGTSCELIGEAGTLRWTAPPQTTRRPEIPPPDFTAFAAACRGDLPSPVPWQEALASIEILDALYRSAREGREVVVGRGSR